MIRKKICFVVASPGSASAFLKDHITALSKEYDVYLAGNGSMNDRWKLLDIKDFFDFPINREISLVNDWKALNILAKYFKEMKFDAIHSVTPKAGLLCALAGKMAGVKNRIHIYTGQVWATRHGMMRSLLKMMDKLIASFDTNLLVDGESQRQFLIREGVISEANSKVLAHGSIAGVQLERFVISDDVRKTEREKMGFAPDDVVFIFMGRLNHDKGIGELYQAFNKLVEDCPKAKLVFYGDDEEGYEAKAQDYPNIKRNENFFYPGRTSKPYDSLQEGDVFVLPTWREGFGSSVIEAQALKLPVITSDAYGVVDASVPGETGLRCKVNDPEGLYECMEKYYNSPEMRRNHGENGRKRVIEKFDNNVVTAAWIEYYHELLK